MLSPAKRYSLLAFMAHPSDEAFTVGGTLALYARRGVRVYAVFPTRGEVGEMDPPLLQGFASIGARREAEAQCAAGILGLSGSYFLGYRDSGMPGSPENQHPQAFINVPLDEAASRVAHYIRMLKPQVVITHDPIGGYKHPDHIALNRAVKRAFELAPDPNFIGDLPPFQPSRLYYQTIPKSILRSAVRLAPLLRVDPHHFGRNGDIDLAALVTDGDFPIHARIDCHSVLELRDAASACHASQGGDSMRRRGLMAILQRLFGATETFMRAYPPPSNDVQESDLFKGLVE